jgi:hypothetical protein
MQTQTVKIFHLMQHFHNGFCHENEGGAIHSTMLIYGLPEAQKTIMHY